MSLFHEKRALSAIEEVRTAWATLYGAVEAAMKQGAKDEVTAMKLTPR